MGGLTYEQMNGWRMDAYNKLTKNAEYSLKNVYIVNPVLYYNFEEKLYQTQMEVEEFDLKHVITSDIVIVNLDGLNDSIGTIIEIHNAHYHHKIPVLAFGDKKIYEDLHPWIKNDITRVEENIDNVIEYINNFYFI